MTVSLADGVMLVGLVVGAGLDYRSGIIPNALTFPMIGLGIALGFTLGAGSPDGPLGGVYGTGLAFAIFYPLWVFGVVKGGDAKLLMAVGACAGWRGALETTIWWAITYLPVGLAVLAIQGKLPNLVATARYLVAKNQGRDPGPAPEPTMLRTGPIIAVAGWLAWGTTLFDRVAS